MRELRSIAARLLLAFGLAVSGGILVPAAHADDGFSAGPAAPSQQTLRQLYHQLGSAAGVLEGHAPRVIYVFFDPNCPYCHLLFDVSRPFVAKRQVAVRWLPVGFLVPSSEGKAAAILAAKQPKQAFEYNEDHYRRPGGGGVQAIKPSKSVQAALDHNLALFQATQAGGVPLLIWKDRRGQVQLQDGAVDAPGFSYIVGQVGEGK